MSFASKVLYTGDGSTTDYTVNMPYISQSHIAVYVNGTLRLTTMHYNWSGPSTIRFVDAPKINDAIVIQRATSPNNILVDFVDGSVLNADDLDTAYLHNYYLTQEYADTFNEVINNALTVVATELGVVEVNTDFVIQQMVAEMLEQPAADELQARITDIDLNAEAIVTLGESLQVQINTLATGIAATVYIQPGEPVPGVGGIPDPIPEGARWYDSDDNNTPYIYQDSAWLSIEDPRIGQAAADISVLQVDVVDNAAAIVDESVVRANADTATASTLALIGAENAGKTAFILDLTTAYVGPSESLGTRFSTLQAEIDANETTGTNNAAAVTAEQVARVAADGGLASDITALDVRVTSNEGDISTNVSAISGLQTQITTNAGDIAASASDITQLEIDVDLRTTAFHQATPPTANNSGDMWVDTDDGKLYIWNGAAWVNTPNAAVTANAGAISTLQTDVTTNAGNINVNAADITSLEGSISTIQGDIIANSNAIDAVEINVSTNAGNISTNALAITDLESDIDLRATVFEQSTPPTANNPNDLWIDTDDNKLYVWSGVAWVPRQDAAISGNATAIGTLQTDVTAAEGNIASNASDITNLNTSVGTLNGQMSTAQADITANASSISTAEGNISSNASDISSLTSTVDLKTQTFVQAAPPTATSTGDIWYDSDDDNKIHRWNGTSWVDVTNPVIAANASAVSSLQTLTTSQGALISTNASDITTLTASVTALDGEVNTAQVDIVANAGILTLEAKYGVTLNVNGYITGFAQNNDGSSGTFVILADKFAVVDPSGDPAEPEYVPFAISGGKIVMTGSVSIDGDLIVSGSINGANALSTTVGQQITTNQIGADQITAVHMDVNSVTAGSINVSDLAAINADLGNITAGTITMNTTGYIRGGATAYGTGTGFWFGYDAGAYKFRIGNTTDNYMQWDGTKLQVIGDILVGEYIASDSIILSATTERKGYLTPGTWYRAKTFTIDRAGAVKITFDMRQAGPGTATNGNTPAEVRVYKNTTIVSTPWTVDTVDDAKTITITGVEAGDEIHCDLNCGTRYVVGDQTLEERYTYINDVHIKADVQLTTGGTVDKD
jgi:peptidoglycan hydrolase CwlO-like protein